MADPDYLIRVRSALARYHGIPDGVERRPRKKPASDGQTRKRSPEKNKLMKWMICKAQAQEPSSTIALLLKRHSLKLSKLISEAIQSIESIEKEVAVTDGIPFSPSPTELASHIADEGDSEFGALADPGEKINGWHAVPTPMDSGIQDLQNGQHALQGLEWKAQLSCQAPATMTYWVNDSPEMNMMPLPNGLISGAKIEAATTTKKWVRGRLVEVGEGS
ncbi:hypothetical protein HAX54_025566 [Datura stramonium]|uniref:Uncharacterized protein n=1 Tax=Datura stramonium TaxID=4076 RepID=A0ABS8S771_DATST|nr:hypothetical protein [Datura stramonium]